MIKNDLPPIRELIKSWRSCDELFFLKKYFDESHGLGSTKLPTPASISFAKKKPSIFQRIAGRFIAIFNFFLLLVRCGVAPKGRILAFNHSTRIRQAGEKSRPLYLSENLDLSQIIIFEDSKNSLNYKNPGLRLNSTHVDRVAALITTLLSRLYQVQTGTTDPFIINFAVKRALWRFIFLILSPKSINLIVWYGKEAIISAAKSLDICVSDIQHGIIYRSHPFYNLEKSRNIPRSEALLPDFCYVYGQYWRDLLLQSGWSPSQVKIIGYFLDTGPACPVPIDSPYILYTTQPHTSQIIKQHIQSILPECRRRRWKIAIAPHPNEAKGLYQDILEDDVILTGNDSYDLLRECVVHISVSSTLLWEAMAFNKPSYILQFGMEAQDLLTDLVKFGFGRPLENGEFPSPYSLPMTPSRNIFFEDTVDSSVFV
ncbi:MAG: hypothetical protein ACTHJ1_13380 [Bordetella sp.]|uniref:hypothetical protein n=1 Tax=Bordetella sp. TaxID=28081 RepID=UPI003F7BA0FF